MEKHLKDICHGAVHSYGPTDMQGIPNVTGCFELDAVIVRSKDIDMLDKLSMYIKGDTYNSSMMDK
jgi:hypothetical protein